MALMKNYIYLKGEDERKALIGWWRTLVDNRGARARLRRAGRAEDVLLTQPFFQFLTRMPASWAAPNKLISSAMVAALLAHVKNHVEANSFAAQLAAPKKGGNKSAVSELRFQQLQKIHDPETFFRRLLRALALVENRVNIFSLTDSALHWMTEYQYGVDREPMKRLAVRWANDYYITLKK